MVSWLMRAFNALSLTPDYDDEVSDEYLDKLRRDVATAAEPKECVSADYARPWALAQQIKDAVDDTGFDSRMLDELPATYVIAAILLKVKE